MPSLNFTQSVGAGAVYLPLNGWQYEYVPRGGVVKLLTDASAVGVVLTFTAGSDTLMERSPVPAGGTAGVIPSSFDVDPLTDEVMGGDRVKALFENTTGGA
ncbi:unnamed protein product, partial [marine sediment metagenome]